MKPVFSIATGIGVTAMAVAGFIGWRVHSSNAPRPVPHVVVIYDRSLSSRNGCAAFLGQAEQALSDPRLNRRSTFIALATGDADTANEPVEIARYQALGSHRAMAGRQATRRRRQEILADLGQRCRQLPRTNTSPLFLALARGAEQLKALGCRETSPCSLYMQTDGEETVEPAIVRQLSRGKRKPRASLLPVIAKPQGLRIMICGPAETVGTDRPSSRWRRTRPRTAVRLKTLRRVWSAVLGPEAVFEPLCPKVSADATHGQGATSATER